MAREYSFYSPSSLFTSVDVTTQRPVLPNAWSDWGGPWQDVNSVRVMSSLFDFEVPDFVVYLGDVVTTNNDPVANASSYWDLAVSPNRSRGIPFTSLISNHDDAASQWPMEWFLYRPDKFTSYTNQRFTFDGQHNTEASIKYL